jgi:hypothetical protein
MQAVAAELSGYARQFRCSLERRGEKSSKTVCFDASIFKKALKQTRSVCVFPTAEPHWTGLSHEQDHQPKSREFG